MKLRATMVCLAGLMTALAAGCGTPSTNRTESGAATASSNAPASTAAAKPDPKVVAEELRALLTAHDKALSEKSLEGIMTTFSTDANTVMLGTGSEEKWVGPQEIRGAYTEILKDYDPNTLQCACDWKTGGSNDAGTMAWLAAICGCKDSLQGKARDYQLNVSAAAEKQGGNWKFVLLHMSNAFQPPVTK